MENIKKHAFKIQIGTAVTVAIFIIISVWSVATMKADIEKELVTMANQYEHCSKWYVGLDERVEDADDTNQAQDLIIVEIRTKLSNIEALLLDLKHKLE